MPNEVIRFESMPEPAAIIAKLERCTDDELASIFQRAETATARGWMVTACVVGVALAKARYGDSAWAKLAGEFRCAPSTVYRLANVYNELISPRLAAQGQRARFPLAEQRFYTLAVEGAEVARKKPLALLEEAEAARAKDPEFTTRAFKRRIFGEKDPGRRLPLMAAMMRLANAQEKTLRQLVTSTGAAALTAALDAAVAKLDDVRRLLHPLRDVRSGAGAAKPEEPRRRGGRAIGGRFER